MIHSSSPGAVEFNIEGACSTSLNVTAPSTTRGFGNYFFSAPTSPTHFNWEQQPQHTPLIPPFDFNTTSDNHNPDFEFDCNAAQLYKAPPLSADELFDGGKIKPIKLIPERRITHFPTTPRSPKRMIFKEGLSQKKDIYGATEILLEEEKDEESSNSSSASSSPSSWRKRWNLKELLLFRSKSEGDSKDPLKKREIEEDLNNSSFRSTGVVNSVHITKTRKEKGKRVVVSVSAHELHYRVNRAVSEEMRRKTSLPYKRTVLMEATVETDSLTAVNLINKDEVQNHPAKTLIEDCKKLKEGMLLNLVHVRPEGNKCADYMSKLGRMQGQQAMRVLVLTNELVQLLKADMQGVVYPRED